MHPFLPRIRGFHPLPPPGHVIATQEARWIALGRMLAANALVPREAGEIRQALQDAMARLRRDIERDRQTHGPRLAFSPRPPHPADLRALTQRHAGEPFAQIHDMLDPNAVRHLEPTHRSALTRLRALSETVRKRLVDAQVATADE